MDLDELKSVWKSEEEKLEKNLKLNEEQIGQIQSRKIASKLTPLYRKRLVEFIFHIAAIFLLTVFIFQNFNELPYALSGTALLVFYFTTLANAYKQIKLIKKLDNAMDLATMQSNLIVLQTHIINYAKLAVLFIPSFLAYPVVISKVIKDYNLKFFGEFDIIEKSNGNWWTMMIVVSAVMIPLGIWFYYEVSYQNINKPFVKRFIKRSSGTRVTKAMEFLNELQVSKQNHE